MIKRFILSTCLGIFLGASTINASEPITLMAVGDVMLARSVGTRMIKYQDWRWPFGEVAAGLDRADLVFGNLESPFGYECQPTDEGMRFCADSRAVGGLTYAGFDILSLANNHMYDQGKTALLDSQTLLNQHGIAGALPYEIAIVEAQNQKLAFIALDDTLSPVLMPQVIAAIQQAHNQADQVIISLHWGIEYTHQPSPRQVELSHLLIDAGADLIIGHHPHWRQPPELYRQKWIIYSLGNFVFDQMWSEETRLGWVAEISVEPNQSQLQALWPVQIQDYGQPHWIPWVHPHPQRLAMLE